MSYALSIQFKLKMLLKHTIKNIINKYWKCATLKSYSKQRQDSDKFSDTLEMYYVNKFSPSVAAL